MHLNKLKRDELLHRAFHHFDKDNSGGITTDEIMAGLKDQGISHEEAEDILAEWDADHNGSIRCARPLSPEQRWLLLPPAKAPPGSWGPMWLGLRDQSARI